MSAGRLLPPALVALLVLGAAAALAQGSVSYEPPATQAQAELVAPRVDDDVSAIEVARDGTILFAEINGPVWRLDPGATERRLVFDPPVVRGPEWGVVGLALAPDFAESGAFFVTYMTGPPGADPADRNVTGETRVVRVVDGKETLVFSYPATRFHNSGRLLVHDGLLFVSRGDQVVRSQSQDRENQAGNILRLTLDGKPAPGNPFGDETYAYGFRNPFGLAWDGYRDRLVESEVGNNANEEVNAVRPGGNYGWGLCEGPCDPPREGFEDPLVTYPEVITPTGLVVVGKDYYHGSFNHGTIWRVHEAEEGWSAEVVWKHPGRKAIIDVERSPDGRWLYFGAWDGLWRIPTPQATLETLEEAEPGLVASPPDEPPDEPPQDAGPGRFDPPPTPTPAEPPAPKPRRPLPSPGAVAGAAAVALAAAVAGRRRA